MNQYFLSVLFLIILGVIFFTYHNGYVHKSVFIVTIFLFVLFTPVIFTRIRKESFRNFPSYDQLSNASLDAYYLNAQKNDLTSDEECSSNLANLFQKTNSFEKNSGNLYPPIKLFGEKDTPRLSLRRGAYSDISISGPVSGSNAISYSSNNTLIIKFKIVGPNIDELPSITVNGNHDSLIMVIVSNVEVQKLVNRIVAGGSSASNFIDTLQNNNTYQFSNSPDPTGNILSYKNLELMTDNDYTDMNNNTPVLPGDYVVFSGNNTLDNIPQQFPRNKLSFDNKLGIVVYKCNNSNQNHYTLQVNNLVSDTSNSVATITTRISLHQSSLNSNILVKNNTMPYVENISTKSLRVQYPFLFQTWNLITPNHDSIEEENVPTQYLSFNAVNNKSNVFLSIKDNFDKPLYAQSPHKGSRRSKVLLNDKLPQQWVISMTDNSGINGMFYITTFNNQPTYYLGVDGDKVVASLLGQQTKQFWKIVKGSGTNIYTIMSAYNGRFLAYASEGGYLYQKRGRVFLMDTDEINAPQWKFDTNLDGVSSTYTQTANNDILENFNSDSIFKPMFAARDTPVSSRKNTGRGLWNSSFKQYWNGNYIYCFTNKGRETSTSQKNYLNINLNDSGKGIIKIDPQNMILENNTVTVSPQEINRYGGSYNMKEMSSNLLWGNHAINNDVHLLIEMLDINLPKHNNWLNTLLLPNSVRIKVTIYDKGKVVSLCGTTWNDRNKMFSYCTKVVETFTPNRIVEHLDAPPTSFDPNVAIGGVVAQNTSASAGNYPAKEGQGYGNIHQGPALKGATNYQDPDLNPCLVGTGKKIAIPGWLNDTRLEQVRGTCVTNNSQIIKPDLDPSGQPCSSSKYLSGSIPGVPDTYKGQPARTQQFSGKSNKEILQWKATCLSPVMIGPGVYQAYYKNNNSPYVGYGYWKKKNWMVSTFMDPKYDKNAPIHYIDQNGNQRTQNDYLNSPQTAAYTITNLTPIRQPWNNFWILNNNANVVCQELPASGKKEAFAQLFGTNGSLKYYKFMQIPSGNYRHDLQKCKTQYDNSSSKVVCMKVSDLDPINSPTRNFWITNSRKVVICALSSYKAGGSSNNTDYFAIVNDGAQKLTEVKFVSFAKGNAEYNPKNASTKFVMPYFFRQGGQDMRYNYLDMPNKLVEIRGYNDKYNGKYEKSKYMERGKPIWLKQGGGAGWNPPALRWNGIGWNLCETRNSYCYGSYGRQGYVPSSTTSNYQYNFIKTNKDLENLLPTGVPIGTWGTKNFPNGPRIYPVMDTNLEPCVISGVTVPGWYKDDRFGQTNQCITFPRGKAVNKCCNTTYSQGSKRGQQVTYNGKPACNTNWNWSGYNAGGVHRWINSCIR
jgi:hypothetical protein